MKSDSKGIELGDVVKDRITGFKGVVVAITDWLNGCRRLTLQPEKMKDNKPVESQAFDVDQLELVKKLKAAPIVRHGGERTSVARGARTTVR